jgi:hypothetical protein
MSCDTMYSNAGNYKCISKLQYFQKKMKVYLKKIPGAWRAPGSIPSKNEITFSLRLPGT